MTGLALTVGLAVAFTTSGDPGEARADGADPSLFVDITKINNNVKAVKAQKNGTTGTFTVNCGTNGNGHFNPDNFIAAPGVANGAEHLHDYVGNLTTDRNSDLASLEAGGTTCKNGDKSAYFWPVIRIDKGEEEAAGGNAGEAAGDADAGEQAGGADAAAGIDCPDVAGKVGDVPKQAKAEVDQNLDLLKKQEAEAEDRLASTGNAQKGDANFVKNAIIDPLTEKRNATINRIKTAIDRQGDAPKGLDNLAQCKVAAGDAAADQKAAAGDKKAADKKAAADDKKAADKKAAAGDKKAAGNADDAANAKLGQGADQELEGNDGAIQQPKSAELTFRGNPAAKVVAMPKGLLILYGDAKRSINGDKNTKSSWTCAGFEDKVISDKYVICPAGSAVKRIHDFPSCWDGKNTDSANHRDHMAFPDANGKCQNGFKAVPQLRTTLTYDIPVDVQKNAQYKVDSFPAEEHDPLTDHDDFANVMSEQIMNRLVNCINSNKTCKE